MSDATKGSFKTFGELLKHLRRRARLTQKELGIAVGYSEAHVARLENGERLPDPGVMRASFLDALDLQHEPDLAALLVELAESAHGKAQNERTESPTAHPAPGPTNLPVQLTRFIGREREMAEVSHLLGTTRLLTLTGSGGAGKTRLAIHAGAMLAHASFPDGVWLVELAPLTEPTLLSDTLAAVFGLHAANRSALVLLKEYLQDRELLLILDNCEHLIHACAELAGALLGTCAQLHILATSREPLTIPGEVTWRVPSLAIDEAMQLFAERASATKPGFTISPANTATVIQICQRHAVQPLALELAAARLRTFPVEQIAARLDDAFRLLTGGSRIALPRQQTLRGAIDWSYGLLPDSERTLLRGLSVFAGGWTMEAAEVIHGASAPELLDQLVNKSLVIVEEAATESTASGLTGTRYRLLETIRQYAHEKLIEVGEHEQAHQRHLEYFAGMAQLAKPHLRLPEQVVWLDRLEAEMDNLRAALDWSAQTKDLRNGERLIDGIWWMWNVRDYCVEGRKWIESVLPASLTGASTAHVTACMASGSLAVRIGLISLAYNEYTQAHAVAQQLEDTYLILLADALLGWLHPDEGQAVHLLEEAIRLARERGLIWEESWAQLCLSDRALNRGDKNPLASQQIAEALAGFRSIGDMAFVAVALSQQATIALIQGDDILAQQAFEESLALARGLKSDIQIADVCIGLAVVCLRQGDDTGAMSAVRESIAIYHTVGNLGRVGQCLSVAGAVAYARGNLRHAAELLGATEHLWCLSQSEQVLSITVEFNRSLPAVRAALDPDDFDRAWEEGQKLTLKEAIAFALAV